MKRWNEPKRSKVRIEIIPLIDVMMFLLVFFVLISVNVIPSIGLKTNLPKSSHAQEIMAPLRVIITLGKDGELLVDGKSATLKQLPASLREKQGVDKRKLFIVVNGDEAVALQRLIDVMDVLKGNGFDSLSIAAQKRQD
jgi:biopolymer transport protein ExbD